MATRPKIFTFNTQRRTVSSGGPLSTRTWNDTLAEIASDLAKIQIQWNLRLVPATNGLPDGSVDQTVDAFQFGLDGRHLWVNSAASGTDSTSRYYFASKSRPNTLYEQLENIYSEISSNYTSLQAAIADVTNGLTSAQKAAIGIAIFDTTKTSSGTSIDGRSRNNQNNIIQLAKDVYGSEYSLDNDGNANLSLPIATLVDALLELHNGNWSDDSSLSHDPSTNIDQNDINPSDVENDSDAFAGDSADLEQDLNRLRTRVKDTLGTASWTTDPSEDYVGGPVSLQGVINEGGSAAKSSGNPWGYNWSDISGLQIRLDAIASYTGMDDLTDTTPTYTSTNQVTQGVALEVAISQLDAAIINAGLTGHREGDVGSSPLPSGEHWDHDITSTQWSGARYDDILNFILNPAYDGEFTHQNAGYNVNASGFRRIEDYIPSGSTTYTMWHNRNSYPIVQTIVFDPVAGLVPTVSHSDRNTTILGFSSPVNSGIVIALW